MRDEGDDAVPEPVADLDPTEWQEEAPTILDGDAIPDLPADDLEDDEEPTPVTRDATPPHGIDARLLEAYEIGFAHGRHGAQRDDIFKLRWLLISGGTAPHVAIALADRFRRALGLRGH